jgi:hypothetical protein
MSTHFDDHHDLNEGDADNDRLLEETMREHLSAELDGQLGRARLAFVTQIAEAGEAAQRRQRLNHRTWMAAAVGMGLAASLATFWLLPALSPKHDLPILATPAHPERVAAPVAAPRPHVSPSVAMPGDLPDWQKVDSVVTSVMLDNKPVMLDDQTPARMIRQVSTEKTEWFDERRGVRVETVVPTENTVLQGMVTY